MVAPTSNQPTSDARGIRSELPWLLRLALHGEAPDVADFHRRAWLDHLAEAARHGDRWTTTDHFREMAAHVGQRLRHGTFTGVSTAVLLFAAAGSAFSYAFEPNEPMPPPVHMHFALSLLALAAVIGLEPRWQRPSRLAIAGVLAISAHVHLLTEHHILRVGDLAIGTASVAAHAAGWFLLAFAARPHDVHLRRWAFRAYAMSAVGFSVGNVEWIGANASWTNSFQEAASALAGAALVTLLWRSSRQHPEEPEGTRVTEAARRPQAGHPAVPSSP